MFLAYGLGKLVVMLLIVFRLLYVFDMYYIVQLYRDENKAVTLLQALVVGKRIHL